MILERRHLRAHSPKFLAVGLRLRQPVFPALLTERVNALQIIGPLVANILSIGADALALGADLPAHAQRNERRRDQRCTVDQDANAGSEAASAVERAPALIPIELAARIGVAQRKSEVARFTAQNPHVVERPEHGMPDFVLDRLKRDAV